jgi:hypothetical protein
VDVDRGQHVSLPWLGDDEAAIVTSAPDDAASSHPYGLGFATAAAICKRGRDGPSALRCSEAGSPSEPQADAFDAEV